jgi:hypothetical protein
MASAHLRDVLKARRFRPFRLHTGDGRALDAPYQDFIALHPTRCATIVFGPDDQFETVDLMLVTSIEVGNGMQRRKRS